MSKAHFRGARGVLPKCSRAEGKGKREALSLVLLPSLGPKLQVRRGITSKPRLLPTLRLEARFPGDKL